MSWLKFLCLTLLGLLIQNSALSQTPVSGLLDTNTRWTVAASPYQLEGDVVLQNGAVLTIDPGVTVLMGPGASLTIQNGSIQAAGEALLPIQVRSSKGAGAAPGDWKQWVFTAGTVNTRLENVRFEHGSGLLVQGSAPVFNFLDIQHHQGAAITLDLAASPTGVGNRASGNTLDGIVVPAGEIRGDVKWGLRGIPYLLLSGSVSVGESPVISSITPDTLEQGETVTVTVNGSRLQGLSDIQFDREGFSTEVLPGGTSTQARFSVNAFSTAPGPVGLRLLVEAGSVRPDPGLTIIEAQPALFSLSPSVLYVGQGAVEVLVEGRHLTKQSSLWIDGVLNSSEFVSSTRLRAQVNTPAIPGNLQITLRTPNPAKPGEYLDFNSLSLPIVLPPLRLEPASAALVKGNNRTFTLTLPYPAPVGGSTVNLVSSVPTVATVPITITVAEGESSVSFQLTATDTGNTVITASKNGFVSGQAQVVVTPPPTITLTPVTLALGVGRTVVLNVQSNEVAGAGGLTIQLTSSDPSVATVNTSVTILAGASSTTAEIVTAAVGSTTITAQAPGFVSNSTTVAVRLSTLTVPPSALVAPGLTRSIPLGLSEPAPEGGLLVSLVSDQPGVATVPTSIMVPAGQTVANFTLTGVTAGTSNLQITADGYKSVEIPVIVEVVKISIGVSSISLPEGAVRTALAVTLSRPAPAEGVTVDLEMSNPDVATVSLPSVTIAPGETSGGLTKIDITAVKKGSTTLLVSAAGLNGLTVPVTVTDKVGLVFGKNAVTVGKGLRNYYNETFIYRASGGNIYSDNEAVTVNLVSSDPGKVSVPATVTIPAGSYYVYFQVAGVNLTEDSPVTIDATATGYTAPAGKLAVKVVTPVFNFAGLDSNRSLVNGARDNFRVYVTTPGSDYPDGQTAVAEIPIALSVVEDNPVGIVGGFYSAATGGSAVTQVLLSAGAAYSNYAYVGIPTTGGSYKLQARAGELSGTSAIQNVVAPELRFSSGSAVVGKGLRNYYNEIYLYRTISGNSFSGNEAVTVNLVSSDPGKVSVPATVTIPAGSYYVYFQVAGVDLTGDSPVTIDATATGYTTPAAKLAVKVVAPVFNFAELDPNRSPASGVRDNFRIYVTTPGASYSNNQTAVVEMPIALSIVEDNPAGIVDGFYSAATGGSAVTQVLLPAGATYSNYAYVNVPTTGGSYKVQARAGELSVTSAIQNVVTPELRFSDSSVVVGKGLKNYYQQVYLYRAISGNSFSSNEALTVNLVSSDPSKVSVPATVTIPAGSFYVYFQVAGVDLTGSSSVTIDATATGYTAPAGKLAVKVVTPVFNFTGLDSNRSRTSGTRDDFRVYVTTPGSGYSDGGSAVVDIPIALSVVEDNPTGIVDGFYSTATGGSAVTQVLLPAGAIYSNYAYVGVPTTGGSYKVQARAGELNGTSAIQNVVAPELRFSSGSVAVGKGLRNHYQEVYIYRAISGSSFNGAEALTVNLSCLSTAICKVPATVTIPAGSYYVYFQVDGLGVGNTIISASAVGYNAAPDIPVSVVPTQLNFSGPSNTTIGKQSNFDVYLTVPGASASGSTTLNPISVNLTSSAPGVATVPSTLTIPMGGTRSNTAQLSGVAAGTTALTASSPGFSSVTSSTITVSP